MSEFTDTLRCHDDPRLYLEADILLCASADQIDKRDARVAQLEEFIATISKCRGGMINGNMAAIAADQIISTSSDTWLADKIREVEVKVLEKAYTELSNKRYTPDIWECVVHIENMVEERRK